MIKHINKQVWSARNLNVRNWTKKFRIVVSEVSSFVGNPVDKSLVEIKIEN